VVHEDRLRAHVVDHLDRGTGRLERAPEEVVATELGLQAERRDHPLAGGPEEGPQVVVLAGRLVLGARHPRVGPAPEDKRDMVESGAVDDWRDRGAGGDDHPISSGRPRRGQREEREEVRGVVRADDEEGHAATDSLRSAAET
jgi:hypothetical protein